MTSWDDLEYVRVVALDANTSDRLLAGALAPADAPPGYAAVARLLEALSAQPTADELAREAEHVAMVATAVLSSSGAQFSSPTRSFAPFAISRPRIAAVLIAAGLACTGGIASASAGVLPDPAQDIASAILDKVGISVPDSNENTGTRPKVRGASVDRSDGGKGGDISELATTTELTGVDKGATISRVASDGTSRAEQRGSESTASASEPVATPDAGDTVTTDTTSDETSDDKSSPGRSTADEASGGHSAAGSGNASGAQEKADKVHKSKGS
jgi:hypothetical protein